MKKLTFDDDAGYEAFQFIWIALTHSRVEGNLERLLTMHALLAKMAAISKDHEGGRVLKAECEITITSEEQVLALECMGSAMWEKAVFSRVRNACRFLGADFERSVRQPHRLLTSDELGPILKP